MKIRNKESNIIFEDDSRTVKETVEAAVEQGARFFSVAAQTTFLLFFPSSESGESSTSL